MVMYNGSRHFEPDTTPYRYRGGQPLSCAVMENEGVALAVDLTSP